MKSYGAGGGEQTHQKRCNSKQKRWEKIHIFKTKPLD
jgi:hypothetical protein